MTVILWCTCILEDDQVPLSDLTCRRGKDEGQARACDVEHGTVRGEDEATSASLTLKVFYTREREKMESACSI